MATMDQQFVEFIVKALVSKPDAVEINRTIDEKGVLLELTVDQEDLGRVIGKRGNTAQSIRTLLRALGTKNDARYNLKIVDPEGDKRREERKERPERKERSAKKDENTDIDSNESSASSGNQWAHLSSSNDSSSDETAVADTSSDESSTQSTDEDEDMIAKTKKELADLDDLDL